MNLRRLAVSIVALLPLAALAGGRPDWISGDSLDWPRQKYVVGVGVADDRASAEDRARAEVARVFVTRVVATTASHASETSRTQGSATANAKEVSASDDTRTSTDKDLVGVELVATWQDPATRQVYVLAALDRRHAAARLEAKLAAIDAQLRPLATTIEGSERLPAGLAALRYRAVAKQREPILADLNVVAPGPRDATQAAALDGAARAALGRLLVVLAPDGDAARILAPGVTKGLGAAGLMVRADLDRAAADLVVEVQTSVEDLGRREQWFWTRASATVSVREVASQRVLVQLQDSERQASTTSDGRSRTLKALATRLADRLPAEIAAAVEK
jgi:hypothetical protein